MQVREIEAFDFYLPLFIDDFHDATDHDIANVAHVPGFQRQDRQEFVHARNVADDGGEYLALFFIGAPATG